MYAKINWVLLVNTITHIIKDLCFKTDLLIFMLLDRKIGGILFLACLSVTVSVSHSLYCVCPKNLTLVITFVILTIAT